MKEVEEAIAAVGRGELIVVVDDEDRENEGDLLMAAQRVTPEAVNFMVTHGRGLLCAPITADRADELGLPPMVSSSGDQLGTAFTVSVDFKGSTTGISAAERAATLAALADPATRAEDLIRPGHVFPLRARPGGVLRRPGHTEAAVDLAHLAGLYPAGAICEVMNPDGTMARLPQLEAFAAEHGLVLTTIADLIRYRLRHEVHIRREATARLPTRYGEFRLHAYADQLSGQTHVALVMGDVAGGPPPLVRVHSECLTGDVLGSLRCDCGEQLDSALELIAAEGRGVLLYMRQEGRGIGLSAKLKAYALQDRGLDTVEANAALGYPPDLRDYGTGAQILRDLGITRMRLLTNNPRKFGGLQGYGLEVVERVPLTVCPGEHNRAYLAAKRTKLGHLLPAQESDQQ